MAMKKAPKIPQRVLKIAERCSRGETLHFAHPVTSRGETNDRYWFEPSGRQAATLSAREAIAIGLVVPAGDSLFGGADSQTYRAP